MVQPGASEPIHLDIVLIAVILIHQYKYYIKFTMHNIMNIMLHKSASERCCLALLFAGIDFVNKEQLIKVNKLCFGLRSRA